MSIGLRCILILISVLNLFYIIRKIRQSKLQIEYSLFWIGFSLLLIIMSIFPRIMYWVTDLVGIQSPVNLVFLVMIFILILRNFALTLHLSQLENKVKELIQEIALKYDKKDENKGNLE